MKATKPTFQAGKPAQKRNPDLRELVPSHITKPDTFLAEVLPHCNISPEDTIILKLAIDGYGDRKLARLLGINRLVLRGRKEGIKRAVEAVIYANQSWVKQYKPGDRFETAFVINRHTRKPPLTHKCEPHRY